MISVVARWIVAAGAFALVAVAQAQGTGTMPRPDAAKLNALLEAGDVSALDSILAPYQEAYRSGAVGETLAAYGIRSLASNDPDLRRQYDKWVAEKPGSYMARVARARYLVRQAYLARGAAYAAKTSQAQMETMRAMFAAAKEDLVVARALDPKPTLIYASLISIAQGTGTRQEADQALADAVALDPQVSTARFAYLSNLRPQWGGSIEEMESTVAQWKPSISGPELKALSKYIEDIKAGIALAPGADLVGKQQYREAIAFYDQAIEKADAATAYAMRGYSHAQLGQHDKALTDYDRALELDPEGRCCPGTFASRARTYLALGKTDKALADLVTGADADDAWAAKELAVIYAFGKHGVKPDATVARRWCERSARQGDPLAMYCIGSLHHAGQGTPKDLKKAAHWFEGAAKRGIADAQADLAFMLWEGQGVEQNQEQAIKYWRAAAMQGNARAMSQLEGRLSTWEYFRKVSYPAWVAEQKKNRPWFYFLLAYLRLAWE